MSLWLDHWDHRRQKVLQEPEMPWLFFSQILVSRGLGDGCQRCAPGTVFSKHSCIFVRWCYKPSRRSKLLFSCGTQAFGTWVSPWLPLPLNVQDHLGSCGDFALTSPCFLAPTEFSASPGLLGLLSPSCFLSSPTGACHHTSSLHATQSKYQPTTIAVGWSLFSCLLQDRGEKGNYQTMCVKVAHTQK